jgi:protein SHQ1
MRIEDEKSHFNEDHYLADFFDDSEMIESALLKYEPEFYNMNENDIEYTEKEVDCLKNLPKKTYLLSNEEKCFAYCGLIDILYAYCYNNRATCGEKNVESGWNIAKISSTLTWFDVIKFKYKFILFYLNLIFTFC